MYKLNLNHTDSQTELTTLLNQWNDHSKVIRPIVIVKISEAFTMYHETATHDYQIENREFKHVHPVLINNLETGFSLLLSLDEAGRMLHAYLINDYGDLQKYDGLLKFAHKNRHQEYLDYFYCISINVQRYLEGHADLSDK